MEAATNYPEDLAKMMNESYPGDVAKKIYESDYPENRFLVLMNKPYIGRRCHLGLLLAREEMPMPGFKVQTSSLVRGYGDFKLQLTCIYYSENPRALKNYAKSTLLVLYKWKHKA